VHPIRRMRGRLQVWLAVALCAAVFVAFLVHKPACSSSNMLHHKPVAKFKALTTDISDKAGIVAVADFSVTHPMAAPVAPRLEVAAARSALPVFEAISPQVLSCRLLC
jgi:hypothetical protein